MQGARRHNQQGDKEKLASDRRSPHETTHLRHFASKSVQGRAGIAPHQAGSLFQCDLAGRDTSRHRRGFSHMLYSRRDKYFYPKAIYRGLTTPVNRKTPAKLRKRLLGHRMRICPVYMSPGCKLFQMESSACSMS
jgi:hypothetical protein